MNHLETVIHNSFHREALQNHAEMRKSIRNTIIYLRMTRGH